MPEPYSQSKRNRVRQIRDKAAYDKATVHSILDSALYASVGFVEDNCPVVVPMLFGRDGETLFLHGARKARIIRLLESTQTACVNVTHVDALVIARSAFNSSMNYRSVTAFGTPRLVDDHDEKIHALEIITEATVPGRWDELRAPHVNEVKMTGVIALDIETASAKVSDRMPDDDEADYDIPVWAGILPLKSAFTALEPDDRVPDDISPGDALKALEGRTL